MPKQRFRDSILSMIGEFVALNKNPDFHLTQQSARYIAEAIKDELEKTRASANSVQHVENSAPVHFRTSSTQSAYRQPPKADDAFLHGRRQSVPNGRSHPQRLLQRLRPKKAHGTYEVAERQQEIVPASHTGGRMRKASLISESDESPCSTRRNSHAEDSLEAVVGHIRINPSPF